MPLRNLDPKHCRDRAAHMRLLALQVKGPEAAAVMQKLADDYDKLADRAVLRAGVAQQPEPPGPRVVTGR